MTVDGGTVTFTNQDGLTVQVMSANIPFNAFRIAAHLDASSTASPPAVLSGSTTCANVPMYGLFLETLGLCNPQTDILSVFGGANMTPYQTGPAPGGVGAVTFAQAGSSVVATLAGSQLALAQHLAAIFPRRRDDRAPRDARVRARHDAHGGRLGRSDAGERAADGAHVPSQRPRVPDGRHDARRDGDDRPPVSDAVSRRPFR